MAGGALGAITAIVLAVAAQIGSFAYYGMQPRIVGRLVRAEPGRLDLVQYMLPDHRPVTNYLDIGGAPVHVFLVRDDFRTFVDAHPKVRGGGHFIVPVTLDVNHRYYAYIDSFISGVGEQAVRFTVQNGAPPHHLDVSLERPNNVSHAGPYEVTLSSSRILAGAPVTISAQVLRDGTLVTPPKRQSFGAVAAIVNTGTLQYTGFYEGIAGGLWYPGEYDRPQLRLPPLPHGIYRMWLQLTIHHERYTAPFTLSVQ